MTETDNDPLMLRLAGLRAAANRIDSGDRRMILALRSDVQLLRDALHRRRDELARALNTAGAQNKAANAYSRMAAMARFPLTAASRPSTPE